MAETENLRIGDYVLLSIAKDGSSHSADLYMCSEGIFDKEVVLSSERSIDDCLFSIHLQRQYTASRELREFLRTHQLEEESEEEKLAKYRLALERGFENEKRLNDSYLRNNLGLPVVFGSVVQLFHVKSRKYLQVLPTVAARVEHENLCVTLDSEGDENSWIQLIPRYKVDRDGERIQSSSQVYLQPKERENEYIHSSGKHGADGLPRLHEVNCSLNSSTWRIFIYQSSAEYSETNAILSSQLVYLHDPETLSNLSISRSISRAFALSARDASVDSFRDDMAFSSKSDLVLEANTDGSVSSGSLWYVEPSTRSSGGIIRWKSEPVRFRNLNTGQFMKAPDIMDATGSGNLSVNTSSHVVTTTNPSDAGVSFRLNSVYFVPTNILADSRPVQISVVEHVRNSSGNLSPTTSWLVRGHICEDGRYTMELSSEQHRAVSFMIFRYGHDSFTSRQAINENASALTASKNRLGIPISNMPLDVVVGGVIVSYFREFADIIHVPEDVMTSTSSTVWSSVDPLRVRFFFSMVRKTVEFICAEGVFPESEARRLSSRRQCLLREQGLLDVVAYLVNKLAPLSVAYDHLSSVRETAGYKKGHRSQANLAFPLALQPLMESGLRSLNACLLVLLNCIQSNTTNQLYLANYFSTLLIHLGSQPLAAQCVSEMLSANIVLQETKITDDEVRRFVDRLRCSYMNEKYLRLLQSCCSCNKRCVNVNQVRIVEALLEDPDGVIVNLTPDIQLSMDHHHAVSGGNDTHIHVQGSPVQEALAYVHTRQFTVWNEHNNAFFPSDPEMKNSIQGLSLVTLGLPRLYLSWTTHNVEFSSLRLFGKLSVSVEEVFGIDSRHCGMSDDALSRITATPRAVAEELPAEFLFGRGSDVSARQAIGDYFVRQLYLAAELCFERNYISIKKLGELFPYEVLVSLLKMDVTDDLKSATVRLLLCLHVDVDPHYVIKFPRLSWSYGDLPNAPGSGITCPVSSQQPFVFALLQTLISEHLEKMIGSLDCGELSEEYLKLLGTLVSFGFYGSVERLKSVARPLLRILDQRHHQHHFGLVDTLHRGAMTMEASIPSLLQEMVRPVGNSEYSSWFPSAKTRAVVPADLDTISLDEDKEAPMPSIRKPPRPTRSEEVMSENQGRRTARYSDVDPKALTAVEITDGAMSNPCRCLCCRIWPTWLGRPTVFCASGQKPLVAASKRTLFTANEDAALRRVPGKGEPRIVNVLKSGLDSGSLPSRYTSCPEGVLRCLVEVLEILSQLHAIVDDHNVGIFLEHFKQWYSGKKQSSAIGKVFKAILDTSLRLPQIGDFDEGRFDAVMMDLVMYDYPPLVHSALNLLRAHHSAKWNLILNVSHLQLISGRDEALFAELKDDLLQLERNAETHELWGRLLTDEDAAVNKKTKFLLEELCRHCRKACRTLSISPQSDYKPVRKQQNILRSLGCLDICIKVLRLLGATEASAAAPQFRKSKSSARKESNQGNASTDFGFPGVKSSLSVLEEEEKEDREEEYSTQAVYDNTVDLCKTCNTFLCWYFAKNTENQEEGFAHLDFFVSLLGRGARSDLAVKGLLESNVSLMGRITQRMVDDVVSRLSHTSSHLHEFLAFLALITHIGEKNIPENQLMVARAITAPAKLESIGFKFCGVDDAAFQDHIAAFTPIFANSNEPLEDVLPPKILHYFAFLDVLKGCAVGHLNVATVESRLQSICNFAELARVIVHPQVPVLIKIRMSEVLLHIAMDVEISKPHLDKSPAIWQLLESYKHVFEDVHYLLSQSAAGENVYSPTGALNRQKIYYALISARILAIFVNRYKPHLKSSTATIHDNTVRRDMLRRRQRPEKNELKVASDPAKDLLTSLLQVLERLCILNTTALSVQHKLILNSSLDILKSWTLGAVVPAKRHRGSTLTKLLALESPHFLNKDVDHGEEAEAGCENTQNSSDVGRESIYDDYLTFLTTLRNDESTIALTAGGEVLRFTEVLDRLIFPKGGSIFDRRRGKFILTKLIDCVRGSIVIVQNEKQIEPSFAATATWLMKSCRILLEKKIDTGFASDSPVYSSEIVDIFDECGMTTLSLQLISEGIDDKLQSEAVKLCIGLLLKNGGALTTQMTISSFFESDPTAHLFFDQIHRILEKLMAWHKAEDLMNDDDDDGRVVDAPDDLLILRLLQLMCEGHYRPNQELMRSQEMFSGSVGISVNLLDDFASYLGCLSRMPSHMSTIVGHRVAALILEVIQGPCEENQRHFVLGTDLLETMNRIMRSKKATYTDEEHDIKFKNTVIDVFRGLLEGQDPKGVVYGRVLSVVHLDTIHFYALDLKNNSGTTEVIDASYKGQLLEVLKADNSINEMKALRREKCVVLLQMLFDARPSLRSDLSWGQQLSRNALGEDIGCIEVYWRGELHRRFFHIPAICADIAESSRRHFVEKVDRSSLENQLVDFLDKTREIYREVTHQQMLKLYRIAGVFSKQNFDRATSAAFVLAILINALLLGSFSITGDRRPSLPETVESIIGALNVLQIAFSTFTLVMVLIVRAPVIFQSFDAKLSRGRQDRLHEMQSSKTRFHSFFLSASKSAALIYTASDPLIVYYFCYVAIAVLGTVRESFYLGFLLLDIIMKDSTTKTVLMSIVHPRVQLAWSLILGLIVVYIYSFFIFYFFSNSFNDELGPSIQPCSSLYTCFKTCLRYGLTNGGGIADDFRTALGLRTFIDLSWFLVVMIVLLNVIFGIIIDTFADQRVSSQERLRKTTEFCFICGIDRQQFDRASDGTDGFKNHIHYDHNMWSYVQFIISIWEQDKDDDDGLEQYVRRCIERNEVVWLPMLKAICLGQRLTTDDFHQLELRNCINDNRDLVARKFTRLEADLGSALTSLKKVLVAAGSSAPSATAGDSWQDVKDGFAGHRESPPRRKSSLLATSVNGERFMRELERERASFEAEYSSSKPPYG